MPGIHIWKIDHTIDTFDEVWSDNTCKNLDDTTKITPQGAYTTLRTYNHSQVFQISNHFYRLEETARLAEIGKHICIDKNYLRSCLRQIVKDMPGMDLRIRITLDLFSNPGDIYIARERLTTPAPELYKTGVRVITQHMSRINPKAKLTNFIQLSENVKSTLTKDINEAVMVDGNKVLLEGLTSNFFAVLNGEIWTEENNVLSGITRSIVIDEAEKNGFRLIRKGINILDIPGLDEAFITSTSRSVLPVRQIDNTLVHDGKPGPVTNLLMEKYRNHIQLELEEI